MTNMTDQASETGRKYITDVVELNVGGKTLSSTLATLTKYPDSKLTAIFNGDCVTPRDKAGHYFIDCDPTIFKHILEYLRFGTLPGPDDALEVFQYSKVFGLTQLTSLLEEFRVVKLQSEKRIANLTDAHREDYMLLKDEVITLLDDTHCNDSVVLSFKYKKRLNLHCTSKRLHHMLSRQECFLNFGENLCPKEIRLTKEYDCSDLADILAAELVQLGYGKNVYFKKNDRFKMCEVCHGTQAIDGEMQCFIFITNHDISCNLVFK